MAKSNEPMVLLRVGHLSIVLPDDTGVMQLMKTLKRGESCRDYSWDDRDPRIQLDDDPLRIEMSYVKSSVELRHVKKSPASKSPASRPVKAIGVAPTQLLLTNREVQQ